MTSAVLPLSIAILVAWAVEGPGTQVREARGTCLYFCCSAICMFVFLAIRGAYDVRLVSKAELIPWPENHTRTRYFPTPDHDHDRCASDAIAHAEAICAARKERLTPIRRRVLEALLASHQPLGAYELIDRLAVRGARPAPITSIARSISCASRVWFTASKAAMPSSPACTITTAAIRLCF